MSHNARSMYTCWVQLLGPTWGGCCSRLARVRSYAHCARGTRIARGGPPLPLIAHRAFPLRALRVGPIAMACTTGSGLSGQLHPDKDTAEDKSKESTGRKCHLRGGNPQRPGVLRWKAQQEGHKVFSLPRGDGHVPPSQRSEDGQRREKMACFTSARRMPPPSMPPPPWAMPLPSMPPGKTASPNTGCLTVWKPSF